MLAEVHLHGCWWRIYSCACSRISLISSLMRARCNVKQLQPGFCYSLCFCFHPAIYCFPDVRWSCSVWKGLSSPLLSSCPKPQQASSKQMLSLPCGQSCLLAFVVSRTQQCWLKCVLLYFSSDLSVLWDAQPQRQHPGMARLVFCPVSPNVVGKMSLCSPAKALNDSSLGGSYRLKHFLWILLLPLV